MTKIIYKYPWIKLRLSNIKIKKEIKHGAITPIKIYIIEINKISYILKIKDEKYIRWNVNRIHNNIEFTNNYKYVIKNLDKIILKYFYKILYSIQHNKKVYHIMEKYSSDLDYLFFDLKPSKKILKNMLVKIQIVLFNLNNRLHMYHNDIIQREKYLIRNIMYNKKKVSSINKIKYNITSDVSINIYDDIYEPVIIDFDNSSINKPYFKRRDHFNKMFDNKIHYVSEIIIFTYYILIMIKNNKIYDKKIKNKNRKNLKQNIIKLYVSLKKYKTPTNIDAHFIKEINKTYFDIWC